MENDLIHRPPAKHECTPGWVVRRHAGDPPLPEGDYYVDQSHRYRAGDVVACKCGKTFVAYDPSPSRYDKVIVLGPLWRREGRIERWRRERRQRRAREAT